MRHPLYMIYSVFLLGVLGLATYAGIPLSASKVNEAKVVPKTVRDNPGAYRSHYAMYPRYVGGK